MGIRLNIPEPPRAIVNGVTKRWKCANYWMFVARKGLYIEANPYIHMFETGPRGIYGGTDDMEKASKKELLTACR